jgi:CubicO group peptidase (beta-lactamase class C family)
MLGFVSCEQISNYFSPKIKIENIEAGVFNFKKKPIEAGYILEKKQHIATFCNTLWADKGLNGSILVAKDGNIIYEKYEGYANFENKKPMDSISPLHIASVSKVITATVILKLIATKKIDLNQKAKTILPQLPYNDITIKTLLNHRSGLKNYAYFTQEKEIWDTHKTLTNNDVLQLLSSKNIPLEFPTDTRFMYCNTNYVLLALIIEKITRHSYAKAVDEMIFKPLQMQHSFVFDINKDQSKVNPSYKGNYKKVAFDYLDAIQGDKNIYSTARDLLKFDMGRNSNDFLNQQLLQLAYTPYSNEHQGMRNYGLGMRMVNWPDGKNIFYHNGWWHGNTSTYTTLPEQAVTIIGLSSKMSRKVYQLKRLSSLFGDYPFKLYDDNKNEE